VSKILNALEYLHSKSIAHRDIKPGNVIIANRYTVKIVDFGLCSYIGEKNYDRVGTPGFVAPEIFNNSGHNCSVDLFSLGVLVYTMLSGRNPFSLGSMTEEEGNKLGFVRLPASEWETLSPEGLDFMRICCSYYPKRRPKAEEARQHEWFFI
jgi:serine/threonine protein kinase